jgi:hypothetical protein
MRYSSDRSKVLKVLLTERPTQAFLLIMKSIYNYYALGDRKEEEKQDE